MDEKINIVVKSEIPMTHFFVYNEKQYPFNFDLFKIFSQYYNSNQPTEKNINLLDENINISEASIPDFINFCQFQEITLTKENAPSLLKLSQKYDVPTLYKKAKEYISTHQKEVVVEILSMYHQTNDFSLDEYEEIISSDLTSYIHDDRLLNLPIPILHRILTKYVLKSNKKISEQLPEIIEFLFKCLDHFGRDASVLFDQIDLLGTNGTTIKRLHDNYSEIFDFHFFNTSNSKNIYDLESEIISREEKIKQQISDYNQEALEMSMNVNEEIKKMREQREMEKKEIEDIFVKIPQMVTNEIERIKEQHEKEKKEKDEMLAKLMKQLEEMHTFHQEELRKQHDKFFEILREMNDKLEQLKRPKISRLFYGANDPIGLISILGSDVAISAGGDIDSSSPVSNIRIYNDKTFCNYQYHLPSSEDGFIKFDFGPSRKVDLHSYFIRSNRADPSQNSHPKTWRIEGSNDDLSWIKLDRRVDDDSLNGKYKQCNFVCQFVHYGSESNRFRYIKYVQEDSWYSEWQFYVYITYFELYGDIIDI